MSRKLLVPIDIKNPDKVINDFLYPDFVSGRLMLRAIKSGVEWEYGMVILTGDTSKNDLFKMIIDEGQNKIESVENLLTLLGEYVEEVTKFRIGNVLRLDVNKSNINFILEYKRLSSNKKWNNKN